MLPSPFADRPERWLTSFAFSLAIIAIGYALQISDGHLNGTALIFLTVASMACIAGVMSPEFPTFDRYGRGIVFYTTGAGLAFQLASMIGTPPGIYLQRPTPNEYAIYLGGITAAAAIAALAAQPVRPQVWLPLLASIHFGLGIWMIKMSPAPRIDLFYIQRTASNALVHGRNPYAIPYPDVYGSPGGDVSSAPPARKVYGYPPISYICAVPGYLAGDFRYSQLAAMSVTALLLGLSRPSPLSGIVAALFLFTPRTFLVLELGWTEPFVLVFFAATVFCKVRGHSRWVPVFLGLLISSKQHAFLFAPAAALIVGPPFRWREYGALIGKASLVATAVTLPFFLWNPAAFYRVLTNFATVSLRTDSLSFTAWSYLHHGPYISPALGFFISFVALGVAFWKLPRTPSGFAAAAAVQFLVLFLFSITAFCNYYYMVVGLLCIAVAVNNPPAWSSKGGQTA